MVNATSLEDSINEIKSADKNIKRDGNGNSDKRGKSVKCEQRDESGSKQS